MTTYLYVNGKTIEQVNLPDAAQNADGSWVLGLEYADEPTLNSLGYYSFVEPIRPDDPDINTTFDRQLVLSKGIPVVQWVQREKTDTELSSSIQEVVRDDIVTTARATLDLIQTGDATLDDLTKAVNGLIRLVIGKDLIDGTATQYYTPVGVVAQQPPVVGKTFNVNS